MDLSVANSGPDKTGESRSAAYFGCMSGQIKVVTFIDLYSLTAQNVCRSKTKFETWNLRGVSRFTGFDIQKLLKALAET